MELGSKVKNISVAVVVLQSMKMTVWMSTSTVTAHQQVTATVAVFFSY